MDEFLRKIAPDYELDAALKAAKSIALMSTTYHREAIAAGMPSDVAKVCTSTYITAILAAALEMRKFEEGRNDER